MSKLKYWKWWISNLYDLLIIAWCRHQLDVCKVRRAILDVTIEEQAK